MYWIAVVIAVWFCVVVLGFVGYVIYVILASIFGWPHPEDDASSGRRTGGVGTTKLEGATGTVDRD